MSGCAEKHVLDILSDDIRGSLRMNSLEVVGGSYYYLRETPDFISALDRLRRAQIQEFSVEVPPIVILFRGLEVLLTKGFNSPEYQQLLKRPLYRNAIAASCSAEKRKEFESATEGLKVDHLGLLYDAETYFWAKRSRVLLTITDLLPSCRNILKHFISWWLNDQELQVNDFLAMREKTAPMEPLNEVPDGEQSRFDLLSRALYFSILTVGGSAADKKTLLPVAQRSIAGVHCFNGVDLWLQRVAALKLYELEGFESLSKKVATLRSTYYYYIDLIRGFSLEQKQLLLDEVRRHPDANTTDYNICMSKWLCEDLGVQNH